MENLYLENKYAKIKAYRGDDFHFAWELGNGQFLSVCPHCQYDLTKLTDWDKVNDLLNFLVKQEQKEHCDKCVWRHPDTCRICKQDDPNRKEIDETRNGVKVL